jgi:cytochrome b561
MLGSGFAMEYAPLARETHALQMGWHKHLGALVLLYGVWRAAWRTR